ncbi:efflux RND transporter periplasmic adaptor subunit [Alteromonadaceae bacterium M269]|nr:efflux RND transporter periplasmic adaptor subunit [Alteromonadaceae bacterium M269]
MTSFLTRIRRQPAWIALFIVIALSLWVGSGMTAQQEPPQSNDAKEILQKVRVTKMQAQQVEREIKLYGRTQPDRMATLRSESNARVIEVLAEKGQAVKKGDLLVKLNPNDLEQRLVSAKSLKKQMELELKGAKSLGSKGYQSEANLAQAEANVESANAQVETLTLALARTHIRAPFDGVLNERFVELGDYLREGDDIAEVIDLNPLVIRADVTEADIQRLKLQQAATGRVVSGQEMQGHIRYISSVSTEGTNTFPIEVAVENADNRYVAGMSTELSIPLDEAWAIKITPAVIALDEAGNIGVKTVERDRVKFVPIDIVKSERDGVWLAGLGREADVITLGQGFVRDGDKVEVVSTQ